MLNKVLIVDDSFLDRQVLSEILHGHYEVFEADNGKAALDVLKKNGESISAVLLDIGMPIMDGYEVLSAMRSDPVMSQIPVIVTTCDDEFNTELKALELGANDFALKPYNSEIIKCRLRNMINLRETSAFVNASRFDALTGLYSRAAFFEKAAEMISSEKAGYYVMACFDIDNFKVINDLYGTEKGDAVLKFIADTFRNGFAAEKGICCRITADNFAILYPYTFMLSNEIDELSRTAAAYDGSLSTMSFSIGRYIIDDLSLTPSAMYDRAAIAKASIKGRYDVRVAQYDESMRDIILQVQEITSEMNNALDKHHFEVWLQPQYNHSSGALIGAEALARWRHPKRGLIPPNDFIPIFERNGFVYELDKYIWEQVCILLRKWIDEGLSPLPVSVNVSRYDVFRDDLTDVITGLVKKYDIPVDLLRLEITESAFAKSTDQIINVVKSFVSLGFTVEIDDFGSGYSSLNTLKDVPAQILKLDMRFLESKDGTSSRGGNIVESIVRMTKWLGIAVIAEGVETIEQADYLKSIGCNYIQGYFYSKPIPSDEYEKLERRSEKETKMVVLESTVNLENNVFWDPNSLETLIFNSYIGGACVFECYNGGLEILRANDKYAHIIGGDNMSVDEVLKISWEEHLDDENKKKFVYDVKKAIHTKEEVTGEYEFLNLPGCDSSVFLRATMRLIASTGNRYLIYCTNENITAQRIAEKNEREVSKQLEAIMLNINGGVSVVTVNDDDTVRFLLANDRYYEMLGYTREQFEKEKIIAFDIVHPNDRERVIEQTKRASITGDPFDCVYRAVRSDGRVIWVMSKISVTKLDGVDKPVQIAVASEITERVEADRRAREASERLKAIMDNVESGITAAIVEPGKIIKFLFANDKYYAMLGYTREQYDNEVSDLFELILPDEREVIRASAAESLRTGKSNALEYRVKRRDGEIIWARTIVSGASFNGVDFPVQISISRNISAEKLAVEKLRETDSQLMFLNETAHCLLAQANADKSIEHVLRKLLDYFNGARAYIFEFDYERNVTSNTYEICADGVSSEKDMLADIPLHVVSAWIRVFTEQDYLQIDDVNSLDASRTEEREILRDQGISSLVAAPIRRDGRLIGFIGVDDPKCSQSIAGRLDALGDYIAVMLTRRDLDAKIRSDSTALKNLMNDTPGGFARVRVFPNGKMQNSYFNDGYCRLLGMTPDEIRAENESDMTGLVHPDDLELVRTSIRKLLGSDEPMTIKYRLRHSDGSYIWVMVFARVTKNESNEIYINAYYADLSEEEKREMTFRETLPFVLGAIMESSSDLAFAKDKNFKYICCSNAFAKFAGCESEKNVIGKTDYELFSAEVAEKFRADDMHLLSDGNSIIDMIEPIPSDDGVPHYSNTSKYILRDTFGNVIGLYGVGRDITEYRTAFEQLKLLTNNIPGGLAEFRLNGESFTSLYFSEGFYKISGFSKSEYDEITKDDTMAIIFDEDKPVLLEQLEALRLNDTPINCTCRIISKGGGFRWVNIRGATTGRRGSSILINSVFFDVTSAKLSEEALAKSTETMKLAINLVDNSSSAVFVCDTETYDILYVNSNCAKMCKKNPDDAKGMKCYEFMRNRTKPCSPCYMELSHENDFVISEYFSEITGRKYLNRSKLINWGEKQAIVEYIIDETERINDRKMLHDLVDGIPVGIGLYNYYRDGRLEINYLNNGYYAMIGSSREARKDYSGFSVFNAIHPDDLPKMKVGLANAISEKKLGSCDLRVLRDDGEYMWMNVKARLAFSTDEKYVLYVSYCTIDKE